MSDLIKTATGEIIDSRILNFAKHHRLPGFYFDTTGSYCFSFGYCLLSIFVNNDTNTTDVTVDGVSNTGMYDLNYEWESPETEKDLYLTVCRFIKQYGTKEKTK